jgi:heterotetrameric sarcosine oxidase gamma subunit
MVERVSALAGHYEVGRFGAEGEPGLTFSEARGSMLHQVAAWPDTLAAVGAKAARAAGVEAAPGPGRAVNGDDSALLRVEPLKWWLIGAAPPELAPEEGATLDLSHSRVHLRIFGPQAALLLNRHLPLNLSESAFPEGAVGSSAFHHVGVTLWRSPAGYELFLPRGFALSLWEMLLEGAAQFGFEVT